MVYWWASHAVDVCVQTWHSHRNTASWLLICWFSLHSSHPLYLFTRDAPCNYFKFYRNPVPSHMVLQNFGVADQKTYVTSLFFWIEQSLAKSAIPVSVCLSFSVLCVILCQNVCDCRLNRTAHKLLNLHIIHLVVLYALPFFVACCTHPDMAR
jgi:hypothetical protein